MDLVQVSSNNEVIDDVFTLSETSNIHFIAANTEAIKTRDLKYNHTIPVFAKDNERTISHLEFIETILFVAQQVFGGELILKPAIRVSHPIKGRIPTAVDKPAKDLLEHEKTLYFERMAFAIEIPSISNVVGGNTLNLTIGGVRAYNLENLYSKKSEERFKLFIGFQNKVCTNLCVFTDGFKTDIKVKTIAELASEAYKLFSEFKFYKYLEMLSNLPEINISESQFAQLIGKARMYQMMPFKDRKEIPMFPLSDSQINLVVKDYYTDDSFCRNEFGDINLWKLYNLFTGANKMSYIDSFIDKGVGCFEFVNGLQQAIQERQFHWYLG